MYNIWTYSHTIQYVQIVYNVWVQGTLSVTLLNRQAARADAGPISIRCRGWRMDIGPAAARADCHLGGLGADIIGD